MESTDVRFILGDNIGVLLHNMSQEHIYAYQPEKAVSLWKESFNCSEELAKGLVFGKYICDKNPENEGNVVVCKRENMDKERLSEYRLFDPELFVSKVIRDFRFKSGFGRFDFDYFEDDYNDAYENARNAIEFDRECSITLPLTDDYDGLVSSFSADAMSSVRQVVNFCLKHNRDFYDFEIDFPMERKRVANALLFIRRCRELLEKKDAIMETLNFVHDNCPMERDTYVKYSQLIWRLENNVYGNMEERLATLQSYLDAVMPMQPKTAESLMPKTETCDPVDAYLESQRKIDDALSDFKPCRITDKYDAGFIAPDGTFYGLNGQVSNLLHLQLADAIIEHNGIVVPNDFEYGKDYYLLGELGYVKTCGNHIMHEGYSHLGGSKDVPLTPAQKKAICEYGNAHYDGKLIFGLDKKRCTVERFMGMEDDAHLAELFGF